MNLVKIPLSDLLLFVQTEALIDCWDGLGLDPESVIVVLLAREGHLDAELAVLQAAFESQVDHGELVAGRVNREVLRVGVVEGPLGVLRRDHLEVLAQMHAQVRRHLP